MNNYARTSRHILANAALADPNMTPERRCIGSYYGADLSSGQITNCYAGLGHVIMLTRTHRQTAIRLLDADLTSEQGHLVHSGGSSMAVADWYGLTYEEMDNIIGMSDRKEPTEDINEFLLSRAISAQGRLLMSTRSVIGITDRNGDGQLIYCHFDGYPEGAGLTLLQHWQDESKVRVNSWRWATCPF